MEGKVNLSTNSSSAGRFSSLNIEGKNQPAKTTRQATTEAVTQDAVRVSISEKRSEGPSKYTPADLRAAKARLEQGKTADVEKAPAPKKGEGDVPRVFEGSYKDGVADFGGVKLSIEDNGDVEALVQAPDGTQIRGKGKRDSEGNTVVTLDNGQTYKGQVSIEGDRAVLSDVTLVEGGSTPAKPAAPAQPRSYEGVATGNTVVFDGVTLKLDKEGRVEALIKAPDGSEIRGKGTRESDGRLTVKLDNGQAYQANLAIVGSKAVLSDLKSASASNPVEASRKVEVTAEIEAEAAEVSGIEPA